MGSTLEFAQDEWEFSVMLRYVEGSERILEVGSRYGQSLWKMAITCKRGAKVVSVDWPGADGHPDAKRCLESSIKHLRDIGYDAELIAGDSHDPSIIAKVMQMGGFDFGFIDGDHEYAGAMADVDAYLPICRVLGFHDIRGPHGCSKAWEELKQRYKTIEIVNPDHGPGIGIIFKD